MMIQSPTNQRRLVLAGLLGVTLLVTTTWSYAALRRNHAAAKNAANDLITCQTLAAEIRDLGRQPAVAQSKQIQLDELTRHIEQSTKMASIPPDRLIRIWPDPASRVGNTPYQRKSTQVLFRRVTLRQIIMFLHTISSRKGGPQATRIRLLAPRDDASDKLWTVETTLTHLIYQPDTPVTQNTRKANRP